MTQGAFMILLIVCIIITFPTQGITYDSYNVHPKINEEASKQAVNLETTLKNLGFQKGVNSIVYNTEIFKWFRDGGTKEDAPIYRANNHFHDPLKPWSGAGLSGNYLGLSSLIWAQDQSLLGLNAGGDWSWKEARALYYEALTSKDERVGERKYADTFRALGQVMHLVADASVPAHTRNDIHVFPLSLGGITFGKRQTYESWAQREWRGLNYIAKNIDPSIFDRTVTESSAPVPVSALWDQDKYIGSNPEVTWTTSPTISEYGLAEYSNANFFSEDTIFEDYPHPAKANTTAALVEQYARDGKKDKVYYIQGYTSERLAAYSYLNKWLLPDKWEYNLDDFVYSDYASQLIPRAVGYSAGLLNYFFRGILEISAPSSYVYSITDGSRTPFTDVNQNRHQQFTHIKTKVKNTTPNEAMTDGILQAVARYKVIPNYSPDLSNYPPDGTVMQGIPFSYSVSSPRILIPEELASVNANPTEFTFDFSSDPIPAGITDLYLQIIFKGTLGNEKDIAIAVGMKDLLEPTHHVFWNLTDMFSLNYQSNYHLYTSAQIKAAQYLASLVDYDHDGIFNEVSSGEPYIDPYNLTLDIAYSGEDTVNPAPLVNVTLPAGRFIRLVVLVDRQSTNYMGLAWTQSIQPGSAHSEETFAGVINQESGGAWQMPTPANTFRSSRQHFYAGVLRCEPLGTDPLTGNPICPYPESEAITADLTPYDQAIINFP